jgi:hypothetical protein
MPFPKAIPATVATVLDASGVALRVMIPTPDHDLTTRICQALYREFDLHTIGSIHAVAPKGTLWFAEHSLGQIARQISTRLRSATAQIT